MLEGEIGGERGGTSCRRLIVGVFPALASRLDATSTVGVGSGRGGAGAAALLVPLNGDPWSFSPPPFALADPALSCA